MFSSRTKLLLFLSLLAIVVLVTWLYARQSYSAYNVTDPGGSGLPDLQGLVTGTESTTQPPSEVQPSTLTPTVLEVVIENIGCTLPLEFWLQNQVKIPSLILVNVLAVNQTEVCVNYAGSEICSILEEANQTADIELKQQFLVAIMNYLSGADPSAIEDTINVAHEWLQSHSSTSPITNRDMQDAQRLAQTLQSYNEGDIGPGICEEGMIPLTQVEMLASSPTITSTATSSPTLTSTPTVRRTVVIIMPTSTEAPERPDPTDTSPPPATDTLPVPTATEVSPPTATQIPPPTSTDIPTPTPVPEEPTIAPVP